MEVQQIFSHWQLPLQKIIRTYRNEITCDVSKFQNSLTAQKIKFSIMDFFSKCDQIHSFQRTWSHLLKKSLIENFIFCAVTAFGWILLNDISVVSKVSVHTLLWKLLCLDKTRAKIRTFFCIIIWRTTKRHIVCFKESLWFNTFELATSAALKTIEQTPLKLFFSLYYWLWTGI